MGPCINISFNQMDYIKPSYNEKIRSHRCMSMELHYAVLADVGRRFSSALGEALEEP